VTIEAVLLHPHGDFSGNLLWSGELPTGELDALEAAAVAMRAHGYWVSAYPEGDGVAFSKEAYDPDQALADFRVCFAFLMIEPLDEAEGQARALARLAGNAMITCRYLAPVEALRVDSLITLGETTIHPPVDGDENPLRAHAWRSLCDEAGADIDPDWTPGTHASGTTELLRYPLIERTIQVPQSLIHGAHHSYDAQTPLLRFLLEDADHALDPVRFDACHYRRLHYLPAKPGWIGDTAVFYLMPESKAFPDRLFLGKPYVLRVSNNWLGLQVDEVLSGPNPMAEIVDDRSGGEISLALKAALRAWNRSFYLVELEASFLHLVYAVDALCDPGSLKGDRHRVWISAFASAGVPARFDRLLGDFDRYYRLRNQVVHKGESFAGLGIAGEEACQFMLELLAACLRTFVVQGFGSRAEAKTFAFGLLEGPDLAASVATLGPTQFTLPLASDKEFSKHRGA
jgi:hypothetical protein